MVGMISLEEADSGSGDAAGGLTVELGSLTALGSAPRKT
jgi:hypothetical protein